MVRSTAALAALPLLLSLGLALPAEAGAQQAAGDAPADHTVERGESLWNLSRVYYDDPFQWRMIFNANQDRIDDPNLIYPGQELMIPGVGMVVVGADGDDAAAGQDRARPDDDALAGARPPTGVATGAVSARVYPGLGDPTVFSRPPRTDAPTPNNRTTFYGSLTEQAVQGGGVLAAGQVEHLAVSSDVFYSAPWLIDEGREETAIYPGRVVGWSGAQALRRENASIHPFDLIRVSWEGGAPPPTGTLLQLVRVARSEEGFGNVIHPTGVGRVVEQQDGAVTVEVTGAFRRPRSGDYVLVAPAFELRPGQYAVAGGSDLSTQILGYATDRTIQQPGDVAFLSVGAQDGVSVGDVFEAETGRAEQGGDDRAFSLRVVRVFEDRASARITDIRVPIFPPNARIERAMRMP